VRFAALLVALAACGSITPNAGAGDAAAELAPRDSAARDTVLELPRDADAECPPTALTCTGLPGACPQGQTVAQRSVCGGAPVPVCCPIADCELTACAPCPTCP
jgi:hypothetical protein